MLHWLRRVFYKSRAETELDRELRFHLDQLISDNLVAGMSPEEARRDAAIKLGGIERVKQEVRDNRWEIHLDNFVRDVGYALRNLRRDRRFALIATIVLALGIGASTAIFSVVGAALLRPLPYRDPSHLVWADEFMPHFNDWGVPNPEFSNWKANNHTFEGMLAYSTGAPSNLTGAGEAERIEASRVTANFLTVLGIQPALGRTFLPEEDKPGGPLAVILTDSLWRRKFSADPAIVGKSIELDGDAYTVVGVLPASFRFPDKTAAPECLYPAQLPPQVDWTSKSLSLTRIIGRLAPGVSIDQAHADLAMLAAQSNSGIPPAFVHMRQGLLVQVIPLQRKIGGDVRSALLVLLLAVLFVLLIACVNVANLQLARTAGRRRELAVRAAIGAGRARLLQLLLTEGFALAAISGAAGLLLAFIGIRLLRLSLPAEIPQIGAISIDRSVLLFTFATTCLTAILFGLAPALRASRPDVNDALKDGSRSMGLSLHRGYRGVLVVVEFTLAFLLLIGSGLLIRSFVRLSNVAPGFEPTNVLTVNTELPQTKYGTDQQRTAFFLQILDRLRALPGVCSAAVSTQLPIIGHWGSSSFYVEGQPKAPPGSAPRVFNAEVTPDYFQTMYIPLITGKTFTFSDVASDSNKVIVSAQFAHRFLPAGAPLSKRIRLGALDAPWSTIIGVVGDVHSQGLDHASDPLVYVPYSGKIHASLASVVLRSNQDPRSLIPAVRAQFTAVDPSQPVFDVATMQQRIDDSIETPRFYMTLLTLFASLALLLATVGIYGVISYFVSQRTHEIGIRMALGAQPADVVRLVLGQGFLMILIGLALGVCGSLALTRYLANLLFDISPTDPSTIISVAALLVIVALAACYAPARRAASVDPLVALRYE
ncbi:MAG TPA: ABC transporter permease [Candidatus Acidoferrales bacterium]|nr:ABC transporter permease [Candidatus Acidoferrales bacterium]